MSIPLETARADGRELGGQQGRVRSRDPAQENRDTKMRQSREGLEHLRIGMKISGDKFPPERIRMKIFGIHHFRTAWNPSEAEFQPGRFWGETGGSKHTKSSVANR